MSQFVQLPMARKRLTGIHVLRSAKGQLSLLKENADFLFVFSKIYVDPGVKALF